jgi:adenine-specific DNA-methyltransferase
MEKIERKGKLVFPDVANRGEFYYENDGRWLIDTAYAIVTKPNVSINLKYIQAILNSPLLTFFLKETGTSLRGGYFRIKTAYVNPFPIRTIDFSNDVEKAKHDNIVSLVEQMLKAKEELAVAKLDSDVQRLELRCATLDRQIDEAVYELYGLTEEETKIVEGK